MVWICNRCNRELDGNPRLCPHCGYTIYRPKREAPALPDPMTKLDRIADLRPGWNGDRSEPPTSVAVEVARRLVSLANVLAWVSPRLVAQPIPTNERGVCLEWHERGWDVEIEVAADGSIDVWARELATGRIITYPPDPDLPARRRHPNAT